MTARGVVVLAVLAVSVGPVTPAVPNAAGGRSAVDCRETPVSSRPPNAWMGALSAHWLRQGTLWMAYTRADQAFVARPRGQKIGWFRDKGSTWGRLRVSGSRLDALDWPPLQAEIPVKYPFREGFQSSRLTFSAPGCWQVVARVGLTARFVFVVRVASE